jgi:hypothetical protein
MASASSGVGPVYEVRNYLFGEDEEQFAVYRRWAIECGAPALKALLPRVGGEVVGFWLSTDECAQVELEGTQHTSCSPTNVTWVIRWPSKESRDAGWELIDSSDEYGKVKQQRKQMCAEAGFDDGPAYRQVEAKFCIDVPPGDMLMPGLGWPPPPDAASRGGV